MPLKLKHEDKKNTSIVVWEMDEETQFFESALVLTPIQKGLISTFSTKRKREWLSARYILKLMHASHKATKIVKNEYGKPFIEGSSRYLSISHSHNMATVITSDHVVGIDVQKFHDNIERIAHKFISDEELAYMEEENLIHHMHLNWGAKESMYKAYGKKSLRFAEHMKVNAFELQGNITTCKGIVRKDSTYMQFDLTSRVIDNYILVYAIQS